MGVAAALWCLWAVAAVDVEAAPADEGPALPKLLVLDPASKPDDERIATTIAHIVATEIAATGRYEVVSAEDVRRVLELESDRASVGCDDDGSCAGDIAGALGASLVVFGDLGRLGEVIVVSLTLYDVEHALALGRTSFEVDNESELASTARAATRTLLTGDDGGGPSVAALSLVGGGAAVAGLGAVAALIGVVPTVLGWALYLQAGTVTSAAAYEALEGPFGAMVFLQPAGLVLVAVGAAAVTGGVASVVGGSVWLAARTRE